MEEGLEETLHPVIVVIDVFIIVADDEFTACWVQWGRGWTRMKNDTEKLVGLVVEALLGF
jgi:hypothetical protein